MMTVLEDCIDDSFSIDEETSSDDESMSLTSDDCADELVSKESELSTEEDSLD